jgi:hypothetical protein
MRALQKFVVTYLNDVARVVSIALSDLDYSRFINIISRRGSKGVKRD